MSFYEGRKHLEYFAVVRELIESFGPLSSIADIGSLDTPVATWGNFDQRYTVDRRERPALSGVRQIVGEWPDCQSLLPLCDAVTCLQVLEHLADPRPFCTALFAHARQAVILSVPWRWPAGSCKSHVQDPVDDTKLAAWTHRQHAIRQIVGKPARAVLLYRVTAPS
jgi:hypothetical protein